MILLLLDPSWARPTLGKGLPSLMIQIRSEANDNPNARLSSGNPAGPNNPAMPEVEMSFTARTLEGSDPKAGQTVEFYEDPATAGHLTFNPQTAVTGENGRCNTVVKAIPGTTPQDGFQTQVIALWHFSDTVKPVTSRSLTLRAYSPTNDITPQLHDPLANPTMIRVHYENLTVMIPFSDQTNPAWDEPGRIDFVGNPNWQIRFREDYDDMNSDHAWTSQPGQGPEYEILYNMYQLDGNWPTPDGSLGPPFPALSNRHYVQNTANHEVGHALGLHHNPGSLSALMTPSGLDSYFTWKTVGYRTPQESTTLLQMYP